MDEASQEEDERVRNYLADDSVLVRAGLADIQEIPCAPRISRRVCLP